jgi:hypothetical protein
MYPHGNGQRARGSSRLPTSEAWGPRDKTHTPPLGALDRRAGATGAIGMGPKWLIVSETIKAGKGLSKGSRLPRGPCACALRLLLHVAVAAWIQYSIPAGFAPLTYAPSALTIIRYHVPHAAVRVGCAQQHRRRPLSSGTLFHMSMPTKVLPKSRIYCCNS